MPVKHRLTEREKLQALLIYHKPITKRKRLQAERAWGISDLKKEGIRITQIERNGELLCVFPDGGDRHARRVQRAVLSGCDRIFWITMTIACGKPGFHPRGPQKDLDVLAKQYVRLEKARNDLDAFYQYYKPPVIGSPFMVGASPGLGKSPGFFICPVHLNNPTTQQLQNSIDHVREWIEVNQEDPEYTSFQFNFCFSGHGELDESGGPGIVLADKTLAASELASFLLSSIPEHEILPALCRLDLYLDCCYSGAIAHSTHRSLVDMQQRGAEPIDRSILNIGQVNCACLEDEESYEFRNLFNSVFTFAFLNECSRKQPEGATATNLALRDIGWYTRGQQHPILLDFTATGGLALKFPTSYYLRRSPRWKALEESGTCPNLELSLSRDPVDDTVVAIDPIGDALRYAQALKAECTSVERDLCRQPVMRVAYSREEILTNKRFPFL
jgi:hypothetical protein